MRHGLPLSPSRRAAAEEVGRGLGVDAAALAVTTPPDPSLGDYAVACFSAAKQLRAAPAALAARVAASFQPTRLLAAAQAAGPYVNFQLDRGALFRQLFAATLGSAERLIPTEQGEGRTVIVDFASPNIAKHLAYHHIRSTVIGNALVNIYRALGYRVVGINHLGDWGTTFGLLLAGCERWGVPEPLTISALNDLYVRFRQAAKEDPGLEGAGRMWFKRLEDGEASARTLWQRIRDVSLAEFQEVFDVLGVRFDEVKGESEYETLMPAVIRELEEKGLASESEGALVVDLSEHKMPPLLLRKADGATLYATRDLAAALQRWDRHRFDRAIYVTDKGQALHFRQMFTTLAKAGRQWASRMVHVGFGLVRFRGRKTGTRTGNVILLKEVLAEAQTAILEKLQTTNPDLSPALAARVALTRATGVVLRTGLGLLGMPAPEAM
jgi:arginyl-tRNA synthetase